MISADKECPDIIKAYLNYGLLLIRTGHYVKNSKSLAYDKPAIQSSTEYNGDAGRTVDENPDGAFGNGSVTHTANEEQPWWQIDLQGTYLISKVEVHNRMDRYGERLKSFFVKLSLDGKTWTDFYVDSQCESTSTISCNNVNARYVRIQLKDKNPLGLTEVDNPPTVRKITQKRKKCLISEEAKCN